MPFSIFNITNEKKFLEKAIQTFRYQYKEVDVYRQFVDNLGLEIKSINTLEQIPFLPIELFKSHKIIAKNNEEKMIFTSSGTTGSTTSKHFVTDLELYNRSMFSGFEAVFDNPEAYCILGLLPSYLERSGSSLVFMMDKLITKSNHPSSGFYLDQTQKLLEVILENEAKNQKTILVGVTFALLDFADEIREAGLKLNHTIIVETGGMKGRKKEMVRAEVHQYLKNSFGLSDIYSEYGMTELLSQAWSTGEGLFTTPPWMKIMIRETNDPFHYRKNGKAGAINVIDLANYHSCSFIATSDLGRVVDDKIEILGRFDHSDIRGCSLLVI